MDVEMNRSDEDREMRPSQNGVLNKNVVSDFETSHIPSQLNTHTGKHRPAITDAVQNP